MTYFFLFKITRFITMLYHCNALAYENKESYLDDNTVLYCDYDINKVVNTLEADSLKLINWFSINLMKANPDKFQAIAIGKKTNKHNLTFNCEDNVKLLGVTIDSNLNFNNHISEICKKKKHQGS